MSWKRRRRGDACVNVVIEGELSRRPKLTGEKLFLSYYVKDMINCG